MMARDRDAAELGDDDRLLGRLRQLSLVELESLLAGASGAGHAELLAAYADDLLDALAQARRRMNELGREVTVGPDPLAVLEASPALRARGAVAEGPGRLATRLAERAAACRDLARLDEAAALLLPRLFEIERRRGPAPK
ncbi:MAG TPA: hypothetical protein VK698_31035 [Kofleriaceae bacterium]|nr:hypothetical protein [Kofleriaceae bacterium]